MKNIFKELLKHLKKGKIEIVPNDPKDKKIAEQMSVLLNWKKEKSDMEK